MPFGLRRKTLQNVSQAKLDDAVLLLAHGRFSNAHYLAGFAVEIALKSVLSRRFEADTIPDRGFVMELYTHDFPKLVRLAGLKRELDQRLDSEPAFSASWAIVCEWKPDLRYDSSDAISAQLMVQATSEVVSWIKGFW